jgi:hypothetical protein
MAKSTTPRKSELELAQNTFAEFGTKYIKNWTEQELKKFRSEPVVIPVGKHGFFVGPFKITGVHDNCWCVEKIEGNHIHNFISKTNAILYCLSEVKHRYHWSDEILMIDTKLGRLDADITHYQATLSKSRDNFKLGVVLNRCIDAKIQRRVYQNILKKTLNSAKYLNFGKQPL